jgi:hypothetical protein
LGKRMTEQVMEGMVRIALVKFVRRERIRELEKECVMKGLRGRKGITEASVRASKERK